MRAVQLRAYDGKPESIAVVEMPVPPPGLGEGVIMRHSVGRAQLPIAATAEEALCPVGSYFHVALRTTSLSSLYMTRFVPHPDYRLGEIVLVTQCAQARSA
jgi:hypothetical protein